MIESVITAQRFLISTDMIWHKDAWYRTLYSDK
jgi:hypothetical protein